MTNPHQHLKRLYVLIFVLTVLICLANVVYLLFQPNVSIETILFRGLQYVLMLVLLTAPIILRKRFLLNIPLILVVAIAVFAFTALILGDGLDFYGKYPWWDSLLHFMSGVVLSFIALWIVHAVMPDSYKVVFRNKYFMALYLLMFTLASGALWEICEYTYDDIFHTNTQQFMQTTSGSLITDDDIPLQGHEALRDTMTDLILDFLGGLIIAVYVLIRHSYLMNLHNNLKGEIQEDIIEKNISNTPESKA